MLYSSQASRGDLHGVFIRFAGTIQCDEGLHRE